VNFGQLRAKVIEKLKERATPRFWPVSEINDNINRGCRQTARDTQARTTTLPLVSCDPAEGTFFFPEGVMVIREMKWNGRKIHRVTAEYLDAKNGQNSNADFIRGEDSSDIGDWREQTADDPTNWVLDDGLVRLYPIPSSLATVGAVRTKQQATLAAGSSVITFAGPLPGSKNLIDLYLSGVWQNSDQWSITSPTQITVVGSLGIPVGAEAVFFPSEAVAASTKTFKYLLTGSVGQQAFITPRPYRVGASALSVKINGVSQAPSSITESSSKTFALASALAVASEIEITILESRTAYDLNLRATMYPADMTADADIPDLPQGIEFFHDAIWQWALFECYSREGQTKRLDLAEFYSARYAKTIDDYKKSFGAPPQWAPRDAWRV
jgi:hypothetical protein